MNEQKKKAHQDAREKARRLIDRFESQIRDGFHNLRSRYHKSGAGRELMESGPLIFGDIAEHLVRNKEEIGRDSDMRQVWIWLLADIARHHALPRRPEAHAPLDEWAEWASRNDGRHAA